MKKLINALISTYGKDKGRTGKMLQSIITYIEGIIDPEFFEKYVAGDMKLPVNRTGNKYFDSVIKAIQDEVKTGADAESIEKELLITKESIEKAIVKGKFVVAYEQPAPKVKTPELKENKAKKPQTEIDLKMLNDGIVNIAKVRAVLNQKPLNPVHIPSMILNIEAAFDHLQEFRSSLLEQTTPEKKEPEKKKAVQTF